MHSIRHEGPSDPEDFRLHLRDFLSRHATPTGEPERTPTYVPRSVGVEFQARLADAGLAGLTVPVEYGGAGLDPIHVEIFQAEVSRYWLPTMLFQVTIGMCVPVLLQFGSAQLKRRHIPAMLRGDELWCQMFSEPEAGSDLASLRMTARCDGGHWVLEGQKIWTSSAHQADFAMCVARTDPSVPRHGGVSMFVLPLDSRGVEVRPLRLMSGESAFNEVFCTDVRIPEDHLVGEVNDGWRCVTAMLMAERITLGASGNSLVSGRADQVIDLARSSDLAQDPLVRDSAARIWMSEQVLRMLAGRVRNRSASGRSAGAEGSLAKLLGSELVALTAAELAAIAGPSAQAWHSGDDTAQVVHDILHAPSLSIAGGTSEIQRNIIGERLLGLSREPQAGT